MAKIEKILKKWESGPTEVEREEVLSVLKRYAFIIHFKKGSHIIVSHPALVDKPNFGGLGEFTIPLKKGRKVKGFYIKNILEAITIVREECSE